MTHCRVQPTGGNCFECALKVQNGNVPVIVGPGQCGFKCSACGCMCKVAFEEQHWHMITIKIARAKVRVGSGADAPREEKLIAALSCFIADSLDNNFVRERQHWDERDKEEVFQDVVSKMAHKLKSNSCFASANGKFCISLQNNIEQTTHVLCCGLCDEGGHYDYEGRGVMRVGMMTAAGMMASGTMEAGME